MIVYVAVGDSAIYTTNTNLPTPTTVGWTISGVPSTLFAKGDAKVHVIEELESVILVAR